MKHRTKALAAPWSAPLPKGWADRVVEAMQRVDAVMQLALDARDELPEPEAPARAALEAVGAICAARSEDLIALLEDAGPTNAARVSARHIATYVQGSRAGTNFCQINFASIIHFVVTDRVCELY